MKLSWNDSNWTKLPSNPSSLLELWPKQPEHGDYAVDLALKLAAKAKGLSDGDKVSKPNPRQVAAVLAAHLKQLLEDTHLFLLSRPAHQLLSTIVKRAIRGSIHTLLGPMACT